LVSKAKHTENEIPIGGTGKLVSGIELENVERTLLESFDMFAEFEPIEPPVTATTSHLA
jgi:hypothetical protein